jgi:hypothetical protein
MRSILSLLALLLLASCDDPDKQTGPSGPDRSGSAPTCTLGGTNYPIGHCTKIGDSWMRCTASGWNKAQMGGTGARPSDC